MGEASLFVCGVIVGITFMIWIFAIMFNNL